MKIGVIKTSLKENERRIPIYPSHLSYISEDLRSQLIFEKGYGIDFGFDDEYFVKQGAAIGDRDSLLRTCDLIILPKPVPDDLYKMKRGQVLFGWVHCVQQYNMTQAAIDQRLTLIAWEAMHYWSREGEKLLHIFYKNNEIAGYAAVLHSLQIRGIDGHYGIRRKAVVLGYGSVSRGAVYALLSRGFKDIRVFTQRPPHLVANQDPNVEYWQFYFGTDETIMVKGPNSEEELLIEELSKADIICNGILQDTNSPIMFVREEEIKKLKPGTLIIDISCDEGMGFVFARPTSFENPIYEVGDKITYYSVDHTPAYLWEAASFEISKALLPYLGTVAAGKEAWDSNETIRRAIEIYDGVIQNPNILSFQHRSPEYPHKVERTYY